MKLKLLISSVLAFSSIFVMSAFAADNKGFNDVDFSTKQGQAIEKMYNAGYLAGYSDGSFKPDATITRAELTRVFNQVFGYELNEEKVDIADFNDVEKGVWYYNDVKIAQSNGYINGFNDNTFRPQDNFTRQQTCVVLALAAGLENSGSNITISDEVSPWAESYVKTAIADGAFELENGNNFRATANITRGEVCQALAKYVKTAESSTETTTKTVISESTTANTETTTNKTETTTKASSNGGGSNGGGSNGGSTSDKTTTTEATSEATTTEATTTTVTETTTEATTETITLNDEQLQALDNVIADTENKFVYRVNTEEQLEIVNYILEAMKAYRADPSYDVASAIGEAKQMYYNLSREERDSLQYSAMLTYNMSEVGLLQEVFANLF